MKSQKSRAFFSDIGYIFALIGAAVGLGNIWRFPNVLAKDTGGSVFVIVYFLALLLIALPITLLEINYGLFFRRSIVYIYQKTVPKIGRFLGWKQTFVLGFICLYYLVVLTWVGVSVATALIPSLFESWGSQTDGKWFDQNILAIKNDAPLTNLQFSWPVFGGGLAFILLTFIIITAGIKSGLEKANLILVPALFIGLIGLTIYAVTLNHAHLGIRKIFAFQANNFTKLTVWSTAFEQVIFSTGVLMGILIIFSGSADTKTDKGNQAIIAIVADTLIGFVAGLLVMSIIANQAGQDAGRGASETAITTKMNDLINQKSGGPTLIFSFLPVFFFQLETTVFNGFGQLIMFVFMLTLLFAAFSSFIALVEVFVTSFTCQFKSISRSKILIIWWFGSLASLIVYSFSLGAELVDHQDTILLWLIVLLGVFEAFAFPLYRDYRQIVLVTDRYTYLKTGKFNWLKWLLLLVVAPSLIVIFLIKMLYIFGDMWNLPEKPKILKFKEFKGWNIVHTISYTMLGLSLIMTTVCTYLTSKKRIQQQPY